MNTQAEIIPNPSRGKLFVVGAQEGTELSVYSEGGKEIYHSPVSGNQSIIDLSAQPEGVYFVELNRPGEVELRKITLKKY